MSDQANWPLAIEALRVEWSRPWKLASFGVGLLSLIAGSFVFNTPDWDVPVSIIMASFTYLFAGWAMHTIAERTWRNWPLMLFATWWCVDGCYALYWSFIDPEALAAMRDVNWPVSLLLFWICGLLWYWNGSLRELMNAVRNESCRKPKGAE